MTALQNVRFAHHHAPIQDTKYNGFTVAYVREGKFIKYAWSLACDPDQFNKAIGRKFATTNLETHYGDLIKLKSFDVCSYRHNTSRYGIMHIAEIIQYYHLTGCISHNVLDDMDVFSIKHSAISGMLITNIRILLNDYI